MQKNDTWLTKFSQAFAHPVFPGLPVFQTEFLVWTTSKIDSGDVQIRIWIHSSFTTRQMISDNQHFLFWFTYEEGVEGAKRSLSAKWLQTKHFLWIHINIYKCTYAATCLFHYPLNHWLRATVQSLNLLSEKLPNCGLFLCWIRVLQYSIILYVLWDMWI